MNAAAYSYRQGINIITTLTVAGVILLIITLEVFYTDEIDKFMKKYQKQPVDLMLIFLLIYVVGCMMMVPPNGVLITLAFTFTKIWGAVEGTIYAIIFNFFAQHIAHLATFFLGRYAFRDMIYVKMIRYKKFFVLNRSIRSDGTYIHFLARCSFMCPHPLLTYALSVTDINVRQFINGNHSILPLSFLFIYIGSSAGSLSVALRRKGSIFEKEELYFFILSIVLLVTMISFIWGIVAKEVNRYEAEFDAAHPNGFDLKKAQRAELKRMEEERFARENPHVEFKDEQVAGSESV